MWTGRQHGKKTWHRRLGKTQGILIVAVVVPLGFSHVNPRDRWASGRPWGCLFIAGTHGFDAGGDQRSKKEKFPSA